MRQVTIGLDIGTTSVKGLAVDADGRVLARARAAHRVQVPAPAQLTHDVTEAWYEGPRQVLADLGHPEAQALAVAAMVPSLGPVDADGRGIGPGLLYGDERGRCEGLDLPPGLDGEAVGFLRWLAGAVPDARGYWPAQAVANAALGGPPVIDAASAGAMYPLHDGTRWDPEQLRVAGARDEQLPAVAPVGVAVGRLGERTVLASGLVDAVGEQVVSGADAVGDVLVICGTTLLTWIVGDTYQPVDRLTTIPHAVGGRFLTGGPSNAGGLFLDWVRRNLRVDGDGPTRSARGRGARRTRTACRCGCPTCGASGPPSTTRRGGRRCTGSTCGTAPPTCCAPPTRRAGSRCVTSSTLPA